MSYPGQDHEQGQDRDLQMLFDLSGDLNWIAEFAALFNKVRSNNDKYKAFKMRQILLKQIEFVLNEYQNAEPDAVGVLLVISVIISGSYMAWGGVGLISTAL